ncbi:hypothetical protein N2152v2_003726 [Parachlorella kessleri]
MQSNGGLKFCYAAGHLLVLEELPRSSVQAYLQHHSSIITAICAVPGALASGDESGEVALWDASKSQMQLRAAWRAGGGAAVVALQLLQLECAGTKLEIVVVLHAIPPEDQVDLPALTEPAVQLAACVRRLQQQGSGLYGSLGGRANLADQLASLLEGSLASLEVDLSMQGVGAGDWDVQTTSATSQDRSGFFLEVMVTCPSQVVFTQLELRHDTGHGSSQDRECSHTDMEQGQPNPLTVARSHTYSPAMQTPAFRRQVAPFTASAIVPGTGQACSAVTSGHVLMWDFEEALTTTVRREGILGAGKPPLGNSAGLHVGSELPSHIALLKRQPTQLLRLHDDGAISCLAAAGQHLYVGGAEGTVRVFDERMRLVAWHKEPLLAGGITHIALASPPSPFPSEEAEDDLARSTSGTSALLTASGHSTVSLLASLLVPAALGNLESRYCITDPALCEQLAGVHQQMDKLLLLGAEGELQGAGMVHDTAKAANLPVTGLLEPAAPAEQQEGPDSHVSCTAAALSRDSSFLAVGRSDGAVVMVDMAGSSATPQCLRHAKSAVCQLALAAGGALVAAANAAGEVLIYRQLACGTWGLSGRSQPGFLMGVLLLGEDPAGMTRLFTLDRGAILTEFSLPSCSGARSPILSLQVASSSTLPSLRECRNSSSCAAQPTAMCFAPPMPYYQRGSDATLLLIASIDCTLIIWDADARRIAARFSHSSTIPRPLTALFTLRVGLPVRPGPTMAAAAVATAGALGETRATLYAEEVQPGMSRCPVGTRCRSTVDDSIAAAQMLLMPPPEHEQQPAAWVAFAACEGPEQRVVPGTATSSDIGSSDGRHDICRDESGSQRCGAGSVGILPWPLRMSSHSDQLDLQELQPAWEDYVTLGPACLANATDRGAQSCLESLKASLITATAASSLISTFLIGFLGNLPLALAPGVGISAYVAYTVVGQYGQGTLTYQEAMTALFVEGWIFLVLSFTGVRGGLVKYMPKSIAMASSVGIGLLLAFTGLQNLGVIAFDSNTFVGVGGCDQHQQTYIYALDEPLNASQVLGFQAAMVNDSSIFLPIPAAVHGCSGGKMRSATMWLGIAGGVLMAVLLFAGVKGSLVIGIVFVTVISWIPNHSASYLGEASAIRGGEYRLQYFKKVVAVPSLDLTGLAWDWSAFNNGHLWVALFTFLYIDLLDCTGSLLSMARLMDYFVPGFLSEEMEFPGQMWAFLSDGVGILSGSMMGTTSLTVYVESAAGIEDGGRTGLTAIVVSFFFFVALFFSPILASIPPYATGPALVLVGSIMLGYTAHIPWDDIGEGVPAFLTIIVMPFTYSVAYGVIAGLASYIAIHAPFWLWDRVHRRHTSDGSRACVSRGRLHRKSYLGPMDGSMSGGGSLANGGPDYPPGEEGLRSPHAGVIPRLPPGAGPRASMSSSLSRASGHPSEPGLQRYSASGALSRRSLSSPSPLPLVALPKAGGSMDSAWGGPRGPVRISSSQLNELQLPHDMEQGLHKSSPAPSPSPQPLWTQPPGTPGHHSGSAYNGHKQQPQQPHPHKLLHPQQQRQLQQQQGKGSGPPYRQPSAEGSSPHHHPPRLPLPRSALQFSGGVFRLVPAGASEDASCSSHSSLQQRGGFRPSATFPAEGSPPSSLADASPVSTKELFVPPGNAGGAGRHRHHKPQQLGQGTAAAAAAAHPAEQAAADKMQVAPFQLFGDVELPLEDDWSQEDQQQQDRGEDCVLCGGGAYYADPTFKLFGDVELPPADGSDAGE